ncbi:hypothetical protein [Alteromonas sp. KUL49]|uniref:hypothetical protein n=1 Tax=Alteromonas sp. KUL49 TaxID=2480798 RepID=UPI00102EF2DD|nr:hypothetical protein [Alteromonas sp. KUL49]TAP40697.1 hypothetical protein EYS00_06155 [Alteromonas sp. KUL49]
MIETYKKMPLLMKFIVGHAVFCILFLFKATVPGFMGNFSYQGQVMGFEEIWENDLGIWLIFIGSTLPIAGLLLIRCWKYSREFYSVALLSIFALPYIAKEDLVYLPFALLAPCLIVAYLFKSQKVKQLFDNQ